MTTAFSPAFELHNPFMGSIPSSRGEEGPRGAVSYALVQSGPPVASEEVERLDVDAVEITVRWGNQVLGVSHLGRGESYWVGEGTKLALPDDVLGAKKAPIVVSRGDSVFVVVPPGARGQVTRGPGQLENLSSCAAHEGGTELLLAHGMSVSLEVGGTRADGTTGEPVTFEISTVRAGKVTKAAWWATLAGGATGFVALSFFGHAAIVASLAMFMPAMSPDDNDAMNRDQLMLMQKLLTTSAEREAERTQDETGPADDSKGGGSTGAQHRGESGAAGTQKPVTSPGRMAVRGNEQTSALSRTTELENARQFGMAGLLAGALATDPNAPSSPWATELRGSDALSARGDMFSASIGDASGYGLGLRGTGEGGGGSGEGVGLTKMAGLGGAGGTGPWGIGNGDKGGMGRGTGPGGGGHVVRAPTMKPDGIPTVNGRIPGDVIQRIVRQNFGRFRLCYETGLRGNPTLSGRVATRFVIDRQGAVAQALDGGSDLPDQAVVSCVVRSFHGLSFPAPEGGIVTVTYPLVFNPGG